MNYKWNIFNANLNPSIGSEQKGTRPVLVISDEDYNSVMSVVTILPITSLKAGRKVYPNEVLIPAGTGGLISDSIILSHQIRTIAKDRSILHIGSIAEPDLHQEINESLKVHLNL